MQPAARLPDAEHELTLDEGVHVFVSSRRFGIEEGRVRSREPANLFEPAADRLAVRCVEHAGRRQALGPGLTARHIVFEEAPVESERPAELKERRIRRVIEAARPEMRHYDTGPSAVA